MYFLWYFTFYNVITIIKFTTERYLLMNVTKFNYLEMTITKKKKKKKKSRLNLGKAC